MPGVDYVPDGPDAHDIAGSSAHFAGANPRCLHSDVGLAHPSSHLDSS